VLTSVMQRLQLPRPSVGRSLIRQLPGVWRHTGVRFLLSGAAAVLTSVLQRLQLPRPSVGPSLIRLLLGVWRHTGVRFLVTRAAAVLTSVPQQLQPSWPSVGRLLIRCLFRMCGWTRAPCTVPRSAVVLSMLQQLRNPSHSLTSRRPAEAVSALQWLVRPCGVSVVGNQLVWRGCCLHSGRPLSKPRNCAARSRPPG
jgi:hypothetical protein